MGALFVWNPALKEEIASPNFNSMKEDRIGVMLHYDGSRSDYGAVAWFKDPECKVSYHWLVLDDGSFVTIAPEGSRAWHAGKCVRSSPNLDYADANSAFYGIAIAATDGEQATAEQLLTVAVLVQQCFALNDWDIAETWRIVGHNTEAWPRGRKIDPAGSDPSRPVLSIEDVRTLVGRIASEDADPRQIPLFDSGPEGG